MARYKIIGICFFILFFAACTNKYKVEEIYFQDQPSLDIDDKYFSIQVDSVITTFASNMINRRFRTDYINGGSIYRRWARWYNRMAETRGLLTSRYSNEGKPFCYLIGVRKNKAFYIYWVDNRPRNSLITSTDIGKYTLYLETNLPADVIKRYFPKVGCTITNKQHPMITYDQIFDESFNISEGIGIM